MTLLKLVKILIFSLPEILNLIRAINAHYDEEALDAKIKEDIGKVADAFKNKDSKALHDLFNS